MKLVIVESPTKAKTISRFLGKGYSIESSYGHVRDLPKSKMGIDIEHGFIPQYVIPRKAQKNVTKLKKLAGKSEEIYFATDEDREGEAISWHLSEILKTNPEKIKRITFHEITEHAILDALKNPRAINLRMVDAQQARRVLDRLVGYELSPFLWRKVVKGLSAGRVQSVAVRLIVEREREIQAFKAQEYWTVETELSKEKFPPFTARLVKIDNKSLEKFDIADEIRAKEISQDLEKQKYAVSNIAQKEVRKTPHAPFTTSTLQQEANRRLGFSAKQTMMFAQQLYEGQELGGRGQVGLITYMRTDSLNLSEKFLGECKQYLEGSLGKEFSLPIPRQFKTKAKLAQEAHEAIRPTDVSITPDEAKKFLDERMAKLYELIWRRAVASQMPEARFLQTAIDITAGNYGLRANGNQMIFEGFLKIYPEHQQENILPHFNQNDALNLLSVKPEQHFTEPPARFSEAGLIKVLEEYGIGRPSTYAPTIATIVDRGYVEKIERRLKPTDIAFLVNDLLVKHFPEIVDYKFTAEMEDSLDKIAHGTESWNKVIENFYKPFKANLMKKDHDITKKDLGTETETSEICEKCGKPMVVKLGRFGKFLACTGFPDCRNTKQLSKEGKIEEPAVTDEKCPNCGAAMVVKQGRFGQFLGCSRYPECKTIKNIQKSTGVKCPECKEGDIAERRSKQGRTFYSCGRYPDCKFALWSKPTGESCPQCSSLLVFAAKGKIRCSSKECKFEKEQEDK